MTRMNARRASDSNNRSSSEREKRGRRERFAVFDCKSIAIKAKNNPSIG